MAEADHLFIDGGWVPSEGTGSIKVVCPSTEEVIGSAAAAVESDVDRAVRAAAVAGRGTWGDTTGAERADHLRRLVEVLKRRAPEVASLIVAETGTPAAWATFGQVWSAIMTLELYAELAETFEFEETRSGMLGACRVRHEPVGVCAAIVPWNAPLFTAAMKVGPALAAGCTVVLKPAPETPLDAMVLAEASVEAGLPAGVLNVVTGGPTVGAALVAHPLVRKVGFTGSTEAGRAIAAVCGPAMRRTTLELGGKSAAVLLDDADLEEAVATLIPGASLPISGQACAAHTRILAPRSRLDEVAECLAEAVRSLVVGDPTELGTQIGPMVTDRHRDRVEGFVERAVQDGADVIVGGPRPDLGRGWYVAPTLLAAEPWMEVAREEVFGPVLALVPYDDEADALRITNDSDYGLSGSVWSEDPERGYAFACKAEAGTFMVNSFGMDLGSPFGGVKGSGIGRELGPEGLRAYLEPKTIQLPFGFA